MKDNLDTSAVVDLAEAVRLIKAQIGDEQTQHNLGKIVDAAYAAGLLEPSENLLDFLRGAA